MDFQKRIVTPDTQNFYKLDGYFIWDGSIIKDKNGLYHLFASRWPDEFNDINLHWLTNSKIFRATAPTPMGPFTFAEELTSLTTQHWASGMVHNPRIHEFDGKYYLYYIGAFFDDINMEIARKVKEDNWNAIRFRQRIGVAVADSPEGPWTPCENNPILDVRPGMWDASLVVNPSVLKIKSGKYLMIYKSTRGVCDPLIIGAAISDTPIGKFERTGKSPFFEDNVEDPCFWEEDGQYWMLLKDMTGAVSKKPYPGSGVLYKSNDGLNWEVAEPAIAYDFYITWVDGKETKAKRLERPFVYLEDNKPKVLTNAMMFDGESSGILFREITND